MPLRSQLLHAGISSPTHGSRLARSGFKGSGKFFQLESVFREILNYKILQVTQRNSLELTVT